MFGLEEEQEEAKARSLETGEVTSTVRQTICDGRVVDYWYGLRTRVSASRNCVIVHSAEFSTDKEYAIFNDMIKQAHDMHEKMQREGWYARS